MQSPNFAFDWKLGLRKLALLLTSRKFLAAVVSLAVVFGVIQPDAEGGALESILTITTAIAYILAVALEDGLMRR